MADQILQIADDFWNVRGSFRIGGLVDIRTHASLVRRRNGRFVMLDSYALKDDVERTIMDLTEGGRLIEAVLNVHPFHTVFCKKMHAQLPDAKWYGTSRHHDKAPDLGWEPETTDDPALHEQFASDFDFTVPRGVDFISSNESIHFSSVLVRHRASRTVHVDDTLNYVTLPGVARLFGMKDLLQFHPTLSSALEQRPGAAADFRTWAQGMITDWSDTENLCTAHTSTLEQGPGERRIVDRIKDALANVERTLAAHARKHGA